MSVQRATISAQRMLPDRSAGVLTRKPVTGYVFPFSCPIAKDSAVCTALVAPPSGLFRGRPIARGFFRHGFFPSRVFPSALGLGNRALSRNLIDLKQGWLSRCARFRYTQRFARQRTDQAAGMAGLPSLPA